MKRQAYKHTDRRTGILTDGKMDRKTDKLKDRHKETQRQNSRQTDRQTYSKKSEFDYCISPQP